MRDLYIVSDLHLASGGFQEDFYADAEFARFLQRIHRESPDANLVLNGDIVDFLQVVKLPPKLNTAWTEKIYGLGTEETKCAWKLQQAMQTHQEFFDALADFALAGHRVSIIKGNHDVEWCWPKVRDAFYNALSEDNVKALRRNISIDPWFYYEKDRVWIEHGNQYDDLNSFRCFLAPLLPADQRKLILPFGSFFVRYFFNKVENIDPLADNFRPVTAYLPYMFRSNFLKGLRVGWHYIPFFFRMWPRVLRNFSDNDWKKIRQAHDAELHLLAKDWKIDKYLLIMLDAMKKEPMLEQKQVFRSIMHYAQAGDEQQAEAVRRVVKTRHIVFGHTHVPKKASSYLNTGTWSERVLLNNSKITIKKEFPYVRLVGSKASLNLWKG